MAVRRAFKGVAFVGGAGLAWYGGSTLGDMVFGEEPLDRKNEFLVPRGERFERERPIHRWSWDRPEHKVQLSTEEWRRYPLEVKKPHGKDGVVLRFQLPSIHGRTGIEVSSYILLRFKDADGKWVVRPYTPISLDWEFGHFDLMVKKYKDGKMGNYLGDLNVGDRVEVKGPFPKIDIQPNSYSRIGLIGGGSGITPLWQVMFHLAKDPKSKTNCSLLYANHTPEDIMMKKTLTNLENSFSRMDVFHTVTRGDQHWKGHIGRINKQMIESKMPKPGQGLVMVCGPPGLVEAVAGAKTNNGRDQGPIGGLLKEMGYKESDVFKF
eukprot:TRINITY_DN380_c0_g4_i1.p1 TRINITY_DN380_c0_g4~~TRINITY_DN380_c0_g4_i1.p1  ORF type:complete len:322 (+),score=113.57 TRINITY_DN380_c0_g4_i1:78-1043(+)